jgi:hypothetical protein
MKIKDIVVKEGLAATYKIVRTGPEGTVLQSPDMHTTLTLDPEASKGIVQNPDNPNQFTLSQAQAAGTTNPQQPQGPKQGAEVEIPANEGMGGSYDMTTTVMNPAFIEWENGAGDENNPPPETIKVGVNYSISGEERPATWGYHGGEPAEHPELDDVSVFNLETGEDITDQINIEDIEDEIWKDAERSADNDFVEPDDYYDETIGGDPADDFIDDVTDHEFEKAASPEMESIKRLAGL